MKHIFSILLIFCGSSLVYTQKILTDFKVGTSAQRVFYASYNNVDYALVINNFDVLKTYSINVDTHSYLHSRVFEGLRDEHFVQFKDNFIFIEGANSQIAYNFVDDEILEIPFFDGPSTSTVRLSDYSDFVLTRVCTISYDTCTNYVWDIHQGVSTVLSDNYIQRFNQEYYITYDNEGYYLKQFADQQLVTKISGLTNVSNFLVTNSDLIYYDADLKKVVSLNLRSQRIDTIYSSDEPIRYINDVGKYYTFSTSGGANRKLYVLKKATSELYKINLSSGSEGRYLAAYKDIIISYDRDLRLYDLMNDTSYSYLSYTNTIHDLAILDNGQIIHKFYDNLKIIDLTDFSERKIDLKIYPYDIWQMYKIEKDSLVFLSLDHLKDDFHTSYIYNKTTQLLHEYVIDSSLNGMSEEAEIFEASGEKFLFNQNLYLIKEDRVEQLNDHPLHLGSNYEYYDIRGEILFWVEEDSDQYTIVEMQGNKKNIVGHISKTIPIPTLGLTKHLGEYAVVRDRLYFSIKTNDDLYYIDLQTNELVLVDPNESEGLTYLTYHNDYIYYFNKSNELIALSPDGKKTILGTDILNLYLTVFETFKGKLIFSDSYALYEIIDDQKNLIYTWPITSTFNTFTSYGDEIGVFYIGGREFFYDGNTISPLTINNDDRYVAHLGGTYISTSIGVGTNTALYDIRDMSSNTVYPLPKDIENERPLILFPFNNHFVLITIDKNTTLKNVKAYKVDLDFTNFEFLETFVVNSRSTFADYTTHLNEAFVYIGNKLFWLDQSFDFHQVDKVIGSEKHAKLLKENDVFYFIAIDPKLGRQLCNIYSYGRAILDVETQKLHKLHISPNPAAQYLTIHNADLIQDRYYIIFNVKGEKIQEGTIINEEVDISALVNGVYIIKFIGKNHESQFEKFVKN